MSGRPGRLTKSERLSWVACRAPVLRPREWTWAVKPIQHEQRYGIQMHRKIKTGNGELPWIFMIQTYENWLPYYWKIAFPIFSLWFPSLLEGMWCAGLVRSNRRGRSLRPGGLTLCEVASIHTKNGSTMIKIWSNKNGGFSLSQSCFITDFFQGNGIFPAPSKDRKGSEKPSMDAMGQSTSSSPADWMFIRKWVLTCFNPSECELQLLAHPTPVVSGLSSSHGQRFTFELGPTKNWDGAPIHLQAKLKRCKTWKMVWTHDWTEQTS